MVKRGGSLIVYNLRCPGHSGNSVNNNAHLTVTRSHNFCPKYSYVRDKFNWDPCPQMLNHRGSRIRLYTYNARQFIPRTLLMLLYLIIAIHPWTCKGIKGTGPGSKNSTIDKRWERKNSGFPKKNFLETLEQILIILVKSEVRKKWPKGNIRKERVV